MPFKKNIIHRFRLSCLTPVSIGGDLADRLSPYSDFVVSEDEAWVYYINQAKLEQAILEKGALEDYISFIQSGMDNNRSLFNLGEFLAQRLKMDVAEVTARKVPNRGIRQKDRQQLTPVTKTAGRPFLPGSSLKGAFRTAILYHWLVFTPQGKKRLGAYAFNIQQWRELYGQFDRLRRDRNKSREGRSKMRDLKGQILKISRRVFNEEELFGSLREDYGQDSRRIKFRDVSLPDNSLVDIAMKRIRLLAAQREGNQEIPLPREAVHWQEPVILEVAVEPGIQNENLRYWEGDTKGVVKTLSFFGEDAIYFENNELGDANYPEHQKEIESLRRFYATLNERAADGEAFLRLGFGKTVFDNSLGLALLNGIDDERKAGRAMDDFKRAALEVGNLSGIFPVTRTVTFDNLPLGWLKIEPA